MTAGEDKGYDTAEFVDGYRDLKITPHVEPKISGGAIDGRTTLAQGYAISKK
jgi:hypothetical protein